MPPGFSLRRIFNRRRYFYARVALTRSRRRQHAQ